MMQIIYNYPNLVKSFNHLRNLLGIAVGFMDASKTWWVGAFVREDSAFCHMVQKIPEFEKRCKECDKNLLERCLKSGELEWHICHAGLFDALMPIKKEGLVVGYLSFGQIRNEKSEYNLEIVDEKFRQAYEIQPYFSEEQLESLREIIPQILFSNNIQVVQDTELIPQIVAYIEGNLQEDLSLTNLCNLFHVSKNYLYRNFHEIYHTGINEYVIRCRINTAKKMLRETEDPVCVIAQKVGINSCTYFSRIFKKYMGISPNQYRKRTS